MCAYVAKEKARHTSWGEGDQEAGWGEGKSLGLGTGTISSQAEDGEPAAGADVCRGSFFPMILAAFWTRRE
jgi:hypothetical protein